jgi:hypothetical protein
VPPDAGTIPPGIEATVTPNLGAALQALYANATP